MYTRYNAQRNSGKMDSQTAVDTREHVLGILNGYQPALVVANACKVEIFDKVDAQAQKGSCTASGLAAENEWNVGTTSRLLNALVALKLLIREGQDENAKYNVTPAGATLMKTSKDGIHAYAAGLSCMLDSYDDMANTLKTGKGKFSSEGGHGHDHHHGEHHHHEHHGEGHRHEHHKHGDRKHGEGHHHKHGEGHHHHEHHKHGDRKHGEGHHDHEHHKHGDHKHGEGHHHHEHHKHGDHKHGEGHHHHEHHKHGDHKHGEGHHHHEHHKHGDPKHGKRHSEEKENAGPEDEDAYMKYLRTAAPEELLEMYEWDFGVLRPYYELMFRNEDLRDCTSAVDLGGGTGELSFALARTHPKIQVTVFEAPPVAKLLQEKFIPGNEDLRVLVIEGDFFKDPLPKADMYILANVLHGMPEEKCKKLLTRVYDNLEKGGRLLIAEKCLYDNGVGPLSGHMLDLQHCGGHVRTAIEFKQFITSFGFTQMRVVRTKDQCSVDFIFATK